ncbi:hypothetical protein Peur_069808 [Populus x canadensis]
MKQRESPNSPTGGRDETYGVLKLENPDKERKIVVLRYPDLRDWPVLCQETSGSKTLMCGLEAFSKVNNIQPGDECIFGVEDVEEAIFVWKLNGNN